MMQLHARAARVVQQRLRREMTSSAVSRSSLLTVANPRAVTVRLIGHRNISFGFWSSGKDQPKVDEGEAYTPAPSSAVNVVDDLSVLPDLPKPPRYPCPHLTDEEVSEYLQPLYRRSWYLGVRVLMWNGQIRSSLLLAKRMDFLTFDDALKFTNDVAELVRTEKHHPQISIASSGRLSFECDTHTATIPGICPSDPKDPQHIHPGVTLRDVRLALLVEALWEKHRDELKTTKAEQYQVNTSRHMSSVRKASGYRAVGYFRPDSFLSDLRRNVKMETIAFLIGEEVGSR